MKINQCLHRNLLFSLLLILALFGCSTSPGQLSSIPLGKKVDLSNSATVKNKLYAHYENWKGVEYSMGGLDQDGIDCSGFVYVTFRSQLGINLPRSTELQAGTGQDISRNKLRAGDLVFFKTARKVRHVGIYIENDRFVHASTSSGVMISELNDTYWKSSYWKSRRP